MKVTLLFLSVAFAGVLCKCPYQTSENGHRAIPPSANCIVNRMLAPVCGDDGCWYTNKDFMECVNMELRDAGKPEVKETDRARCDTTSDQVNPTPAPPVPVTLNGNNNLNNNLNNNQNNNQNSSSNSTNNGRIELLNTGKK